MNATVTLHSRMRAALLAVAALLAACGGKPPAPTAPDTAPAAAAQPPETTAPAAAPVSRLAPDTVMARVDGVAITAADVDDALAVMPTPDRQEYTTTPMIRELVESLVDRKLMAATARREGLDRDPVMKEMLGGEAPAAGGIDDEQMLAGVWLETELARLSAPTDDEAARDEAMATLRERLRKGVNVEIVDAAVSSWLGPAP